MVDVHSLREDLVLRSVERLVKLFEEHEVVIVIPPSPLLGDIASRIRETRSEVSVIDLRKSGGSVDGVVGRVKSRSTGERILVLPEDTFTALEIAESLKREVRNLRVCLLNLTGVAEGLPPVKNLGPNVERLRVDYGFVKKRLDRIKVRVDPDHRGIHLAALIGGKPDVIEEVRGLAPEKLDIKEVVVGRFLEAFPALMDILLSPTGFAAQVIKVSVGFISSLFKEMEGEKELCKRSIMEFFTKSSRVMGYVDEEAYRDVFDYVAIQWNLRLEELSNLVRNAGGMLASRGPGEVEKLVEEGLRKIEEKIREHERRLSELENEAKTTHAILGIYRDVEEFPYIRFENGKPYIRAGGERQELAVTEHYDNLSEELLDELEKEGLVIVKGSSGSGKSTLMYYTVAKKLRREKEPSLRSSKERGSAFIVYMVGKLNDGSEQIGQLLEHARESLVRVLLVYDPVPPGVYTGTGHQDTVKKEYVRVGSVVDYLLGISSSYRGVAMVFIALPSDLYEHAKSYLEGTRPDRSRLLRERAVDLDAESRGWRRELVRRILEAYSGCPDVGEVAGRIAELESSHALIAKYTGLMLKRHVCRVSDLNELISSAQGESEKLVEHIVRARLGLLGPPSISVVVKRMIRYGMILALRRPFTDVPFGEYIATPALMSYLMEYVGLGDEEIERNCVWLSMKNEDLVENVFNKIVEEAKKLSQDIRDFKKHEATHYILTNFGKWLEDLVNMFVGQDPVCWKKAIFISGSVPFDLVLPAPLNIYKRFKESLTVALPEMSRKCVVEDLFVVDDDLTKLADYLIFKSSYGGESIVRPPNICSLTREAIEDVVRQGGSVPEGLLPYLLGLAKTSLESHECINEALSLLRWVLDKNSALLGREVTELISDAVANRLKNVNEAALRAHVASLLTVCGDPDKASEIAEMVSRDIEKLKPWEKAILAYALLHLATRVPSKAEKYINLVLEIGLKIMAEDKQLGLFIVNMVRLSLVSSHIARGDYPTAIYITLERVRRQIGMLRGAIEESGVSDALREYLRLEHLIGPERVKDLLIEMEDNCLRLEAMAYAGMGIYSGGGGLLIEASKKYDELAERAKGTCRYFTYRLASIASRIIAAEMVDDEALRELEEVYAELLRVLCLDERADATISRAVLKSALGRPAEDDVENVIRALTYYMRKHPERWVVSRLLLHVLTGGSLDLGGIPDLNMVRKIFRYEKETLSDEILSAFKELLERYGFPKELTEAFAPDLAKIRVYFANLAFLLHALTSRDFMRAAAHAVPISNNLTLFGKLVWSLKRAAGTRSLDEKIKLLLVKVFLMYIAL